jgi:hypothetical protein
MMLADSAEIVENRLHILGAGWMVRDPQPGGPSALGITIAMPRDQLGTHDLRLELLDASDNLVHVDPPDGPGPLLFNSRFDVGGLDDPSLTVPVLKAAAIRFPPFALQPGTEYRWQLHLDGQTREEWAVWFRTTPPEPPSAQMPPQP